MRYFPALLLVLAVPGTLSLAATLNFDKFDSGSKLGWNSMYFVATGGAGDGGSYIAGYGSGNYESRWMGDFSVVGANLLRLDMMAPPTSEPHQITVEVLGPESTIDRWVSAQTLAVPNDGVWRTYSYALTSDNFLDLRFHPGVFTFEQALKRVVFFNIVEYQDLFKGTLCFDNIELASLPEPNALAAIIQFAMIAIGLVGRRSR